MKYLVIEGTLNGTGIRDKCQGRYIAPEDLGLSLTIKKRLKDWLLDYENEYYNDFADDKLIEKLDQEGKEIALTIKKELSEVKIEYFSDARMTNEIL